MIPLFPLNTTLFPDGTLVLRIFEIRYLDMMKKCLADGSQFGVVALLSGREVRTPEGKEVLADYGTMARIDETLTPMPGLLHVRCTGTTRFSLVAREVGQFGAWRGEVSLLPPDPYVAIPAKLQDMADRLGQLIAALQKDRVPQDEMPVSRPFRLDDSGWVANRWAELLPIPVDEKQALLATDDPVERLNAVRPYLQGVA